MVTVLQHIEVIEVDQVNKWRFEEDNVFQALVAAVRFGSDEAMIGTRSSEQQQRKAARAAPSGIVTRSLPSISRSLALCLLLPLFGQRSKARGRRDASRLPLAGEKSMGWTLLARGLLPRRYSRWRSTMVYQTGRASGRVFEFLSIARVPALSRLSFYAEVALAVLSEQT